MPKQTRSDLRKQGFKLDPLVPVEIRIPVDHWEKLAWVAAEWGLTRPALVRSALADVVKHAKPPRTSVFCGIQATEDEFEAWHDTADKMRMPLETLIKRMMGKLAKQVLGPNGAESAA